MASKARLSCALVALGTVAALMTACGGSKIPDGDPSPAGASSSQSPSTASATPSSQAPPTPTDLSEMAVKHPGPFDPPIASPDVLVFSQDPLPERFVKVAKNADSVTAAEQFSIATFYAEELQVTYAAVNPSSFRRFTPGPTATTQILWNRLADGELALRMDLRNKLPLVQDYVSIGNDDGSQRAHVGAYATLVERSGIAALLNDRWAEKLGMVKGNALLISTGNHSPEPLVKGLKKLLGKRGSVQQLALKSGSGVQTAVLTGGSVARAVGSFTYTVNPDGTVNPDSTWVRNYIRTESVPILGSVTCNKAMLPQLRAAMKEIQDRGLGSKIHPGEYGGCYVPRYIARDAAQGLSFHTWGTAIDLNVPGNQRGTQGEMDPEIVRIFAKWGFNWGGYWRYTDPMHFELARLVSVR